jgi:hypothetical protein
MNADHPAGRDETHPQITQISQIFESVLICAICEICGLVLPLLHGVTMRTSLAGQRRMK